MDEELLNVLANCAAAEPPSCPPWPGWQVTLELPEDATPGDWVGFQVTPGLMNNAEGGRCAFVDAWTDREGVRSEVVSINSDADCVRLPEPSFAVTLAIGIICLIAVITTNRGLR